MIINIDLIKDVIIDYFNIEEKKVFLKGEVDGEKHTLFRRWREILEWDEIHGYIKNKELEVFLGKKGPKIKSFNLIYDEFIKFKTYFIDSLGEECESSFKEKFIELLKIESQKLEDLKSIHNPKSELTYSRNSFGGQYELIPGYPVSIQGYLNDLKYDFTYDLLLKSGTLISSLEEEFKMKLVKENKIWNSIIFNSVEMIDEFISGLSKKEFVITNLGDKEILVTRLEKHKKIAPINTWSLWDVKFKNRRMNFYYLSNVFKKHGLSATPAKEDGTIYFQSNYYTNEDKIVKYTSRVSNNSQNQIEFNTENNEFIFTILFKNETSSFAIIQKIMNWNNFEIPTQELVERAPYIDPYIGDYDDDYELV